MIILSALEVKRRFILKWRLYTFTRDLRPNQCHEFRQPHCYNELSISGDTKIQSQNAFTHRRELCTTTCIPPPLSEDQRLNEILVHCTHQGPYLLVAHAQASAGLGYGARFQDRLQNIGFARPDSHRMLELHPESGL